MKKLFRCEKRRTSAKAEILVFFDEHHAIQDKLQARHIFEVIRNDNPHRANPNSPPVTGLWFREYGYPAFLGTKEFTEEKFRQSTIVEVDCESPLKAVLIDIPWL